MAIYHLFAKVVSRGKGASSIAAAAYRARCGIEDERTGMTHDYSRHQSKCVFEGIYAPKDAPDWTHDRAQLWNHVEAFEKRKDAQLAREFEISLPHELTLDQQRYALQDWVRENFTRKGLVSDVTIHAPHPDSDQRNTHAHVMAVMRKLDGSEFSAKKDRQTTPERKAELQALRESWEKIANRHLERHGHEARIDSRTLEAQGIDRTPGIHLGKKVDEMERRGVATDRGDRAREAANENEQLAAEREKWEAEQRFSHEDTTPDRDWFEDAGLSAERERWEAEQWTMPPEPEARQWTGHPDTDAREQETTKQQPRHRHNPHVSGTHREALDAYEALARTDPVTAARIFGEPQHRPDREEDREAIRAKLAELARLEADATNDAARKREQSAQSAQARSLAADASLEELREAASAHQVEDDLAGRDLDDDGDELADQMREWLAEQERERDRLAQEAAQRGYSAAKGERVVMPRLQQPEATHAPENAPRDPLADRLAWAAMLRGLDHTERAQEAAQQGYRAARGERVDIRPPKEPEATHAPEQPRYDPAADRAAIEADRKRVKEFADRLEAAFETHRAKAAERTAERTAGRTAAPPTQERPKDPETVDELLAEAKRRAHERREQGGDALRDTLDGNTKGRTRGHHRRR